MSQVIFTQTDPFSTDSYDFATPYDLDQKDAMEEACDAYYAAQEVAFFAVQGVNQCLPSHYELAKAVTAVKEARGEYKRQVLTNDDLPY